MSNANRDPRLSNKITSDPVKTQWLQEHTVANSILNESACTEEHLEPATITRHSTTQLIITTK